MRHSTKKLDLTGQQFGKLTALRPAENIGSRTAWLCRCDCGAEVVVKTCYLRNGHVTSCHHANYSGLESLTYIDGTCVEMLRSQTVRKNNTSGVPGVDWQADKHRWRASICFKGKRYFLGSYHRFEDAVKAREKGKKALHETFLLEFAEGLLQAPTADS